MEGVTNELLRGAVYGPMLVALVLALRHLYARVNETQDKRVADANAVKDQAVKLAESVTKALTDTTNAMKAMTEAVEKVSETADETLEAVRDRDHAPRPRGSSR